MDCFEAFMQKVEAALERADEIVESKDYAAMIDEIFNAIYGSEDKNDEK